jgi:hypothetical protein
MRGMDNTTQGDFGEAWLEALAAASGMDHVRLKPDRNKVDVVVTLLEEVGGAYCPEVKVQVKTERGLAVDSEGSLRYRLDADTYNFLRRADHSTPRLLVVFGLDGSGERVKLTTDGTLLCGVGRWVSLKGREPIESESVVIELPATNKLDLSGLRDMVIRCGVQQSTPVPTIDTWSNQ